MRFRTATHYGKWWVALKGKTPNDDDRWSIKFENRFRTKPWEFHLLSVFKAPVERGVIIINIEISFFK